MERRYISDEIGNEYLKWTYGDIVFITASTGAGKSHFILNVYLDWIIQKGGRLLYLVNRRILREQLQNEVNTEIARVISEKKDWIQIFRIILKLQHIKLWKID